MYKILLFNEDINSKFKRKFFTHSTKSFHTKNFSLQALNVVV